MSGAAASPRNLILRNGTQAQKSVTPVDLDPNRTLTRATSGCIHSTVPGLLQAPITLMSNRISPSTVHLQANALQTSRPKTN
ncbi:hypothetical protein QC763_109629 [Podospora pseudopauciseta]|uniref:Uncharacterized protein n=1 Tax=Podospora pseudopauciseta TaxID=2093780 RepID=A0ABR0HYM2_9PEZI|nr:hypothetical protein QC763_109629 [Podospora pseudopauciseta]